MEVREYQENGMNVREIWIGNELKGREEWPILKELPIQPKSEIEILKEQVSQQNQTISDLMDILFTTVPELINM